MRWSRPAGQEPTPALFQQGLQAVPDAEEQRPLHAKPMVATKSAASPRAIGAVASAVPGGPAATDTAGSPARPNRGCVQIGAPIDLVAGHPFELVRSGDAVGGSEGRPRCR